jgi:hypothetical protein
LFNLRPSFCVILRFAIQPTLPTGHCIALSLGAERTMCANLGAAEHFGLGNLKNVALVDLNLARVVYVEAFFAFHSWDVAEKLARDAREGQDS